MRSTPALLLIALAALCTGCAHNPWRAAYQPEPNTRATQPTDTVLVRDAPWERVWIALTAEDDRMIESDTHRDDWTQPLARENELDILEALQLPTDPVGATLLGRSDLATTDTLDPNDQALADFAKSIGADYAIWSTQALGATDVVEREAVTRYRWRWERDWRDGRHRYTRRYSPETVWVPVVVERDLVRWVVFYVRNGR